MPLHPDSLRDMQTLVAIARAGSLSGAARLLGCAPSTVSRQVAGVEARLGARLLQRSTRACALTDAGERYVARAQALLAEIEAAEREVSAAEATPRGRVRVSAPTTLGQHLVAQATAAAVTRWPALQVELRLSDGFADLVRDEIDVAVRIQEQLVGDGLWASRLGRLPMRLYAAPSYLERRGAPEAPASLAEHGCLLLAHAPWGARWPLRRGAEVLEVEVGGGVVSDSLSALLSCARFGAGIAALPVYLAAPWERLGELAAVLPGWELPPHQVWAVHASGAHAPARVRCVIEALREVLEASSREIVQEYA